MMVGSGMGRGWASARVEVMVKPPACGMEGMWTSSHWPGRKENVSWDWASNWQVY